MTDKPEQNDAGVPLPSVERIQQELARAKSVAGFFGKEGIVARLFAKTLEHMLEAELTAHLGYEPYAAEGRNSGNSRNGKRSRKLRTSAGDQTLQVPRDRNSTFHSPLLEPHQTSTNELEEKIIALYAKGVSVRDIQDTMHEIHGVELSPATITAVSDKVSLVEAWQNRPLATIYASVYLDAIHLKIRRDGRVQNTARRFWPICRRSTRRRGGKPPKRSCCSWGNGGGTNTRWRYGRGSIAGPTWQRCLTTQPRFAG